MDWLSRLDPNVIVPLAIAGLTWLYHKARGDNKADSKSIIDSIVENFGAELLGAYRDEDITEYLKKARSYIETRIWSVLSKRGIKKSSLAQKLVNEALERWVAWLGQKLLILKAQHSTILSTVLK